MAETIKSPSITSPGPPIAELVGHLNTEAKCAVYLAIPDEDTYSPIGRTRAVLRDMGAYSLERGALRFNVRGIVKEMGEVILDTTHLDPEKDTPEDTPHDVIKKVAGTIAVRSAALAGSFLDFSTTHMMPLRQVLGERRAGSLNAPSDPIHIRLALLRALADLYAEADGGSFPKSEIKRRISRETSFGCGTIARHISKLADVGMLIEPDNRRRRLELVTSLPNGSNPATMITDMVEIVTQIDAGSQRHIQWGTERGRTILQRSNLLPVLIRRSYASTNHTGKSTVSEA